MMVNTNYALTAASLLLLPSALADGIYSKTSPVLQVDGASYRSLIEKSNYTSILEFYAPWCGHCQNLKPAYEKAAKSLTGLAKVAAVNCDAEENKPFCGSMGVQGFPTLKIVRPNTKKPGSRGTMEDYQGARTAKAIVDAVIDKIPNHVMRLTDKDYKSFLEGDEPKAILFSDKGTVSALLKSIAIEFLGSIGVAQIRDKEKQAVEVFGVDKFPTLVLLPGEGKDPVTYGGEMKKKAMVAFLSQAAAPNPDPAPKEKKAKSSSAKTDKSKSSKASSSFSKASESHKSADASGAKASQILETIADESNPTESPNPNVVDETTQKPIKLPDVAPPITSLPDGLSLQQKCLNTKASTCILALLSEDPTSQQNMRIVMDLSEIHYKYEKSKHSLFPFYQLPTTNSQANSLRKLLKLGDDVELVALNGKRGWYRHYSKSTSSKAEIEDWIDAIRMGEGAKEKVPANLIVDAGELPTEPVKIDVQSKDQEDPSAMYAKLKEQLPEGMDIMFDEIDDEEYERIMKAANEASATFSGSTGKPTASEVVEAEEPSEVPKAAEPAAEETGEHDEL